jgi:hypothetical protein
MMKMNNVFFHNGFFTALSTLNFQNFESRESKQKKYRDGII